MRFALEPSSMLEKCERLQWSVDDIEWDAPGCQVTDSDRRSLSAFMADLYWIESIAAIVFRAMSESASDPNMSAIFASFATDEQRHADAELLLMRRWGMVAKREVPAPNPNARNLIRGLERTAHRVHPAVFSAVIPFTELVLDGALVKHLDVKIKDPICAEVFKRVNADEARHLAVDFYMLEQYGDSLTGKDARRLMFQSMGHPLVMYSLLLGYLPMLTRTRKTIERAGLTEEQLFKCVRRYVALGDDSRGAARHPTYRIFRGISRGILAGRTDVGELLLRISDLCDAIGWRVGPMPSSREALAS